MTVKINRQTSNYTTRRVLSRPSSKRQNSAHCFLPYIILSWFLQVYMMLPPLYHIHPRITRQSLVLSFLLSSTFSNFHVSTHLCSDWIFFFFWFPCFFFFPYLVAKRPSTLTPKAVQRCRTKRVVINNKTIERAAAQSNGQNHCFITGTLSSMVKYS